MPEGSQERWTPEIVAAPLVQHETRLLHQLVNRAVEMATRRQAPLDRCEAALPAGDRISW